MLKKRFITAIFLILITLLILFYLPPVSFFFLTGLITLAAAWEWTDLMGLTRLTSRFLYLVGMVCLFFLVTVVIPLSSIFFCALFFWMIAVLFIILYPRGSEWFRANIIWRGLMGMLVLVPTWVALNYIRNQEMGIHTLLFLFVLVWGADTGAYFIGRKWGKHQLAPAVSPKKTWEGLLGALFTGMLITALTLWGLHTENHLWLPVFLLAFITILFSVVGDLFESLLKRQVGLKDSGHLLPGHGGLLDRIDSLTAAAPIFAQGLIFLAKLTH